MPASDSTEADVQWAVKGWLAKHPGALLVFDDLDDLELVKPYWPTEDPKPFVLATSRRRELSELQRMHRLELDVVDAVRGARISAETDGAQPA